MVRAVHKFDFRLVIKETPNKRRPVEGRSCSDRLMFLTVCVFRRQSLPVLRDPTLAVKVNCILLSNRQYVPKILHKEFFRNCTIGALWETVKCVWKNCFWSLWLWKYLRTYTIPSRVVKPRDNVFEICYEFLQSFERMLGHDSFLWHPLSQRTLYNVFRWKRASKRVRNKQRDKQDRKCKNSLTLRRVSLTNVAV